jgi:hypothetical protein
VERIKGFFEKNKKVKRDKKRREKGKK